MHRLNVDVVQALASLPSLASVIQVAKATGRCERTIIRWLEAGLITGTRPFDRGPWMITKASVERALGGTADRA
ncbi:hypothetical protein ANRL1_02089 [Anaerolineae bacterium]|nr:hypothetical protein ANRL1_02089 [Anaerolineae bacterium]